MLIKENQYTLGQQHLLENLTYIRGNRHLCRRGDLGRLTKTLAGLQLIANAQGTMEDHWALLKTEFTDAGKYAQEMGWNTPQNALEGGLYYRYKQQWS